MTHPRDDHVITDDDDAAHIGCIVIQVGAVLAAVALLVWALT